MRNDAVAVRGGRFETAASFHRIETPDASTMWEAGEFKSALTSSGSSQASG